MTDHSDYLKFAQELATEAHLLGRSIAKMADPELPDDGSRFAATASALMRPLVSFVAGWFGPRCKDFEPGCECCRRWAALDVILDDPWATK